MAFSNNKIKKVHIPKTVEVISDSAFSDCKELEFVCFDDEDVILQREVFKGCEKLKNVQMGERTVETYMIKSSDSIQHKDQVMCIEDWIDNNEGKTMYVLRDLYPIFNNGTVSNFYVLIDNATGEELKVNMAPFEGFCE